MKRRIQNILSNAPSAIKRTIQKEDFPCIFLNTESQCVVSVKSAGSPTQLGINSTVISKWLMVQMTGSVLSVRNAGRYSTRNGSLKGTDLRTVIFAPFLVNNVERDSRLSCNCIHTKKFIRKLSHMNAGTVIRNSKPNQD